MFENHIIKMSRCFNQRHTATLVFLISNNGCMSLSNKSAAMVFNTIKQSKQPNCGCQVLTHVTSPLTFLITALTSPHVVNASASHAYFVESSVKEAKNVPTADGGMISLSVAPIEATMWWAGPPPHEMNTVDRIEHSRSH